MGKPYAVELEKLSEVYDWANTTPVDNLSNFVKKATGMPLYVIGSGGSFSATTFASLLHQGTGMAAKCLTPLEFLGYDHIDRNCSVLIVTAGGNNNDILASFDRAVELKPVNLGVLCASKNNKLVRKAAKLKNVFVHAEVPPTGKDGFLATNTLVATMVWLFRSYAAATSFPFVLPRLNDLAFQDLSQSRFEKKLVGQLQGLGNKETIVCLYDVWSKTAAVDIESKLVEAGLVNVQLADYRNFAHGRHNWLGKNEKKTGIIAMVTPGCRTIAAKTLRHIPECIHTVSLSTEFDGPPASIGLLIQSMFVVKFFGSVRGIDPGRPGVADFGRKIYHLSVPKNNPVPVTMFEELALRRKFGNVADGADRRSKVQYLKKFTDKMSKTEFGAVIFDYDGTLCDPAHRRSVPSPKIGSFLTQLLKNDIPVGVATGRGKSVRVALQQMIPKNLWSKLFIGYYNCSDIGDLEDSNRPYAGPTYDPNLLHIQNLLVKHQIVSDMKNVSSRPRQLTIESPDYDAVTLIDLIKEIDIIKSSKIHIVESDHSVDILPTDVSKLDLFKFLKKKILPNRGILCIGDKGKWPGNDFELLSEPFSLSVDAVSTSKVTCWNLLPFNLKGEKGIIYYLNSFNIKNGCFKTDVSKLRYRNGRRNL